MLNLDLDFEYEIQNEIKNERVLSAIIEFKVPQENVIQILHLIKEIETKIDTVFTVGVVSRFSEDGSLPIVDLLNQQGFSIRPNAKVNVGLGRR